MADPQGFVSSGDEFEEDYAFVVTADGIPIEEKRDRESDDDVEEIPSTKRQRALRQVESENVMLYAFKELEERLLTAYGEPVIWSVGEDGIRVPLMDSDVDRVKDESFDRMSMNDAASFKRDLDEYMRMSRLFAGTRLYEIAQFLVDGWQSMFVDPRLVSGNPAQTRRIYRKFALAEYWARLGHFGLYERNPKWGVMFPIDPVQSTKLRVRVPQIVERIEQLREILEQPRIDDNLSYADLAFDLIAVANGKIRNWDLKDNNTIAVVIDGSDAEKWFTERLSEMYDVLASVLKEMFYGVAWSRERGDDLSSRRAGEPFENGAALTVTADYPWYVVEKIFCKYVYDEDISEDEVFTGIYPAKDLLELEALASQYIVFAMIERIYMRDMFGKSLEDMVLFRYTIPNAQKPQDVIKAIIAHSKFGAKNYPSSYIHSVIYRALNVGPDEAGGTFEHPKELLAAIYDAYQKLVPDSVQAFFPQAVARRTRIPPRPFRMVIYYLEGYVMKRFPNSGWYDTVAAKALEREARKVFPYVLRTSLGKRKLKPGEENFGADQTLVERKQRPFNSRIWKASYAKRVDKFPMFAMFERFLTIMEGSINEQDQRFVSMIKGFELPHVMEDLATASPVEYKVLYDYWIVLLTQTVDPWIYEFGRAIAPYEQELEEAGIPLALAYKEMVRKRIWNDPVDTSSWFSGGGIVGMLSAIEEAVGADGEDIFNAFTLATDTFNKDPTVKIGVKLPSTVSILFDRLQAHPEAHADDLAAVARLAGAKPHPSMLLDEEFLAGPQDAHPDYLDARNKLLAHVEHGLDLAFYDDLEAATAMRDDPTKRKELKALSSDLVARFEALSL